MRKFIAGAALALTVFGAGGTAFAGEVNGNGDPTPIDNFGHAQSICAFSGLNDDPSGRDPITGVVIPLEVGFTQNWGHTLQNAQALVAAGTWTQARFDTFLATRAPGVTCNGATGIVAVVTGG